jgi:hypothetical protein
VRKRKKRSKEEERREGRKSSLRKRGVWVVSKEEKGRV